MSEAAIERGMSLIRTALVDALLPAWDAVQWGLAGASYTTPRLVWQPVAPGQAKAYIGAPLQWQGELALRAQAANLDDAQTLLNDATTVLPAVLTITDVSHPAGWQLQLKADRPINGLSGSRHATVGVIYKAHLLPK